MNCISLYSGADNLGDGVIQAELELVERQSAKQCFEVIKFLKTMEKVREN